MSALRETLIDDPYDAFEKRFGEIDRAYRVATELIEGYLAGKPVNIYAAEDETAT